MGNDHNDASASAGDIDQLAADVALGAVRFARQLRLRRRHTHALTLSQLSILTVLRRDGPMTPSALAEAERVQPPSITRAIHTLEAAGLITRVPHPSSTRITGLALTAAGDTALADDTHARHDWLRDHLAILTPEHRNILRDAAHILTTIVATDTPPPRSRE